jgi:hypothetical protein
MTPSGYIVHFILNLSSSKIATISCGLDGSESATSCCGADELTVLGLLDSEASLGLENQQFNSFMVSRIQRFPV